MIARIGNMQMVPMMPVNVSRGRSGSGFPWACSGEPAWRAAGTALTFERAGIIEGSATDRKRDIVPYAHPRTQGSDCQAAGAAWGLPVLQPRGGDDLRRQSTGSARPCAQLSGHIRLRRED